MKKFYLIVALIGVSVFSYSQVDIFISPYGSGNNDGSSWDDAIDASSPILWNSILNYPPQILSNQPADIVVHFMEGNYSGFELNIEDIPSHYITSVSIYGGYSSSSTGTDISLRDILNYPTRLCPAQTISMSPHSTIFVNVNNDCNSYTIIDGVELDGSAADYNVAAIWTGGNPVYMSNCKIYNYGTVPPSDNNAGSVTYSYLLWFEHCSLDLNSTIINCEIYENKANVLVTFVGISWIENTLIYNNYLDNEFIWDQNGSGDFIDVNNTFFNNRVGGYYINGNVHLQNIPEKKINVESVNIPALFSANTYIGSKPASIYAVSFEGKCLYYGIIYPNEELQPINNAEIYFYVIQTQDGLYKKYMVRNN